MIWIALLCAFIALLCLTFIVAVARESGAHFWRHQYDDAQHKLRMAEGEIALLKTRLLDAESALVKDCIG